MAPDGLVREPIYQQLVGRLRELLRSGEFPPQSQFLTERQIAERFGVSRITANKSLASLVSEGRLDFRKGVGTFVRESRLDYDLRALVSFTDKAKASGATPSTRVLAFERVAAPMEGVEGSAPPEALAALGDEPLWRIERLRLADGGPVILERRWVPVARCPELTAADCEGSLYALWSGRWQLAIAGADQAIRAVVLAAADATLLDVAAGSPALEVTATGRLEGGEPLWWERTLYRGDRYAFVGRIGGGPGAPVAGMLRG